MPDEWRFLDDLLHLVLLDDLEWDFGLPLFEPQTLELVPCDPVLIHAPLTAVLHAVLCEFGHVTIGTFNGLERAVVVG